MKRSEYIKHLYRVPQQQGIEPVIDVMARLAEEAGAVWDPEIVEPVVGEVLTAGTREVRGIIAVFPDTSTEMPDVAVCRKPGRWELANVGYDGTLNLSAVEGWSIVHVPRGQS